MRLFLWDRNDEAPPDLTRRRFFLFAGGALVAAAAPALVVPHPMTLTLTLEEYAKNYVTPAFDALASRIITPEMIAREALRSLWLQATFAESGVGKWGSNKPFGT